MPKLEDYRIRSRLTVDQISDKTGLDKRTVRRAFAGEPVQEGKLFRIVQTLEEALGQPIDLNDVTGYQIYKRGD